jgi:hypothetical protein
MTKGSPFKKSGSTGSHLLSPLGWSVGIRLIFAGTAVALVWLVVAWALGWL